MSKLAPSVVKEKLATDAEKMCFVDVRSEDEFKSGHVPGASLVPESKLEHWNATPMSSNDSQPQIHSQ